MSLATKSRPFITYVEDWLNRLPTAKLSKLIGDSSQVAVVSVDIINGFCTVGPLASPRVQGIVKPIVKLFRDCYAAGVRHFILTQDAHEPDAVEFKQYPPHCVRGDVESQTAPELLKLPFANEFIVFEKNSISSSENTGLDRWLDEHPHVTTFIVVGDCTDLCTYQLAMHLRLRANALQHRETRVILPENCVQTYDTPVKTAQKLGIPAHDGDLLHAIFLYNMWTNGIEVVKKITR
ncbi:MAG: cysteine hydrolase [Thermoflexales bacterium]|nr:cysteine hydrolase [Thermoflexales bacterium]MDW8352217.1 isochorismatase family cysteine hydrolase [Anaerolineae bacterium]